jgi:hypothetical protein
LEALRRVSQILGLHPLVGFGIVAVDLMLFGVESATLPVSWLVTIPVALALAVPCVLIQKFNYGDHWGTAIGKGILVGLLTAIPTPLPSVVPFVGGVLGILKMLGEEGGGKPQ